MNGGDWVMRISVRNGMRNIDRNMVEEISTFDDIDQLKTYADRHQAHATIRNFLSEPAIKLFASCFHRANRAVKHIAVVAGIEVSTSDQDKAIESIKDTAQAFVVGRRGIKTGTPPAFAMASK